MLRTGVSKKESAAMRMFIWGPAVVIPLIAIAICAVLFLGIALIMDALYPNALAFGTVLFIIISAVAFVLARRTEQAHAASNPDEKSDFV
jgi:membrane protein implicated in regulation of membrane protease activity